MKVGVRAESKASSLSASEPGGSWIEKTRSVCGGDACIRKTRITVAGLVEWRNLGLTDAAILDRYPSLTQADLLAAWAYYEQHCQEIQEAIRENQAA